nr:MAG TPA: hypothetical protein [Caudoviricetes sp.]
MEYSPVWPVRKYGQSFAISLAECSTIYGLHISVVWFRLLEKLSLFFQEGLKVNYCLYLHLKQ